MKPIAWALALAVCATGCTHPPPAAPTPGADLSRIDETVGRAMAATGTKGLAIAVVADGQVVFTKAYGVRDASHARLRNDTVMYGASLSRNKSG